MAMTTNTQSITATELTPNYYQSDFVPEKKMAKLVGTTARALQGKRAKGRVEHRQSRRRHPQSAFMFPPTKNFEFVQQASVTDKHFQAALGELNIRARRQYNCRHTYATMCLMAGMNPAFIANQLGHSVQMLLSTYARWINSSTDWNELGKLESKLIGTKSVQTETVPL
ncbi:hypothetical protein [Pseudomonas sp. DG56-2]|uniref:hypothetical protein n=1 Tax=Pseudomonas sp. DG56-2 TaxID=2320270 RepID=UPI003531B4BE